MLDGARQHEPSRFLGLAQHAVLVIPRVRDPGQSLEVSRDAVRLVGRRRTPQHVGKLGELLHELDLFRLGQDGQVNPIRPHAARLPSGHAKDAGHARMAHLHVKDWILLGLTLREIDVEHELGIAALHQEEVARRVHAGFLEEITQRDELPAPFREAHLFPTPHHAHELHDLDVEEAAGIPEGL